MSDTNTLHLGKVIYATELLALIKQLNTALTLEAVRDSAPPVWRLPTLEELRASYDAMDGRFGNWMVWGDSDMNDGCLWVKNMRSGDEFGDNCGSHVDTYLVRV
jgi:hypothetical protein